MKNSKGFTLIELFIVIIVVVIVGQLIQGFVQGPSTLDTSWGMNGRVETRCLNGYVHSVGERGQAHQTLDEQGRGIKCAR